MKETLDSHDAASTGVTLIGVLITSIYGPHVDDGPRSSEELYSYFARTEFRICFFSLLGILMVCWLADLVIRRQERLALPPAAAYVPSPLLPAAPLTTAKPLAPPLPPTRRQRVLLYAFSAAFSGAMSMLLLKVGRCCACTLSDAHGHCCLSRTLASSDATSSP